ncbi:hypothetical protein TSAR_001155, partial [Trichomalopsis sarcophagae]
NKFKRDSRRTAPYQGPATNSNLRVPTGDLIDLTLNEEPTVRSEIHVVNPTSQPIRNRLFCLLPWDGNDREKDEMFFRQFAQFGILAYYETVRDRKGRLTYGYVQYFTEEETRIAKEESDPTYKATFAEPRRLPRIAQGNTTTKFHEKCKKMIETEIYSLHYITCKKQAKWSQEQADEAPLDELHPLKEIILELKEQIARLENQNHIREENPITSNPTSASENDQNQYKSEIPETIKIRKKMDQVLTRVVTEMTYDEVVDQVTIVFKPARSLPAVIKVLNAHGPNNTIQLRVMHQAPKEDAAKLTIRFRTKTDAATLINKYETAKQNTMTVEEEDETTDSDSSSTDTYSGSSITNKTENTSTDSDEDATQSNEDSDRNKHHSTYSPQDNVELIKVNLTDSHTIIATYRGMKIDAKALFRQYGPCITEHYATTADDIKGISARYQMKNHALKVTNLYRHLIQRTDEDIQRPQEQAQGQTPQIIERRYGATEHVALTNGKSAKIGYVIYRRKIDAINAKLNGPQKYKIAWKLTPRTNETSLHFACGDQIPRQIFEDHERDCTIARLPRRLQNEKGVTTAQPSEELQPCTSRQGNERKELPQHKHQETQYQYTEPCTSTATHQVKKSSMKRK